MTLDSLFYFPLISISPLLSPKAFFLLPHFYRKTQLSPEDHYRPQSLHLGITILILQSGGEVPIPCLSAYLCFSQAFLPSVTFRVSFRDVPHVAGAFLPPPEAPWSLSHVLLSTLPATTPLASSRACQQPPSPSTLTFPPACAGSWFGCHHHQELFLL